VCYNPQPACHTGQPACYNPQPCAYPPAGYGNDCGKGCCFKGACCDKYKDCCPKDVCCKSKLCCEPCCLDKLCWKPGYFLHKCKAKLCGCCDKQDYGACHGGCGTACTPYACGSTMVPPGAPMPAANAPAPPANNAAPVDNAPMPTPVKPNSDPKRIPEKVGAISPPERGVTPAGLRTLDLGPSPF
jgi:hypothetical protein